MNCGFQNPTRIVDCGFCTSYCSLWIIVKYRRLQIKDCGSRIAHRGSQIANCGSRIVDHGPEYHANIQVKIKNRGPGTMN